MTDNVPQDFANSAIGTPCIERGTCFALFAYDIGMAINLDRAEQLITTAATQREMIKHKRRAPRSIQYHPAPLRVSQRGDRLSIGGALTAPTVDAVIYDFGAVSVTYSIPLQGSFPTLLALSDALYDNSELLSDSQLRVQGLLETIGQAVSKPGIANLVEDYMIFQIESLSPHASLGAYFQQEPGVFAQILRSESLTLSEQEITDALSYRFSYGPDDLTLIDWNAAILMDEDPEDVRAVLEFANVELLEMRYLDNQLDAALEQAYQVLTHRKWWERRLFYSYSRDLRRVGELQADSAVLFEGVNNALKLLGDQYLARLYRRTSQRLHLDEWDASIFRKLQTLESIYGKISDQQSAHRMELLEWIIILLFVIDLLIPFVSHRH